MTMPKEQRSISDSTKVKISIGGTVSIVLALVGSGWAAARALDDFRSDLKDQLASLHGENIECARGLTEVKTSQASMAEDIKGLRSDIAAKWGQPEMALWAQRFQEMNRQVQRKDGQFGIAVPNPSRQN